MRKKSFVFVLTCDLSLNVFNFAIPELIIILAIVFIIFVSNTCPIRLFDKPMLSLCSQACRFRVQVMFVCLLFSLLHH